MSVSCMVDKYIVTARVSWLGECAAWHLASNILPPWLIRAQPCLAQQLALLSFSSSCGFFATTLYPVHLSIMAAMEDADRCELGDVHFDELCTNSHFLALAEVITGEAEVHPITKQAIEYATKFPSADNDNSSELTKELQNLEFVHVELETGETLSKKLNEWQAVSLCNLKPDSVDAAKALIPSLITYEDEDVEKMLAMLR